MWLINCKHVAVGDKTPPRDVSLVDPATCFYPSLRILK